VLGNIVGWVMARESWSILSQDSRRARRRALRRWLGARCSRGVWAVRGCWARPFRSNTDEPGHGPHGVSNRRWCTLALAALAHLLV